jgi:hypothetical protein
MQHRPLVRLVPPRVGSDTVTRTTQRARSSIASLPMRPTNPAASEWITSDEPARAPAVAASATPYQAASVGSERTPRSAAITASTRRSAGSSMPATVCRTAWPSRRASRWANAVRNAWRSSK